MRELERVIRALRDASQRGEGVVLATVLRVDGSVYRGVGARMIVTASGETVGAVSGGCLEADIVTRAVEISSSGRPELVEYDLLSAEKDDLGLGMGCRGAVDLLLEPLAGEVLGDSILLYERILTRRDSVSIKTLIPPHGIAGPLRRVVIDEEGVVLWGDRALLMRPDELVSELVPPATRLIICGGGSDAIPVARLARSAGMHVTVVDHRPAFANDGRFPDAHVILCINLTEHPNALAERLQVDHRTAGVVMGHSATHDSAYLDALLTAGAGYVGVLGPRRRTRELLGLADGTALPAAVHSPIGLDIGAETPDEIALAIVAEIAAVKRGRGGGLLRDRAGPIHTDRRS